MPGFLDGLEIVGTLELTADLPAALRGAGHDDLACALATVPSGRVRVLITHHGSRGLGAHVFKRGQIAAEKHTRRVSKGIPAAAAWLDTFCGDGPAYWEALPDFLSFAPHGAGREISRTALRRRFPTSDLREAEVARSTAGLDIRWYCGKPDLSETPTAYKDAALVRAQIERFGLAKIIAEVKPLGCIMAGDSGRTWLDKDEELTPKQIRQIAHRAERRKSRQAMHEREKEEDFI